MKRIAIIIDKQLDKGKAANVAAILMGQAALIQPSIYDNDIIKDKENNIHAGIIQSTILLQDSSERLKNFNNKLTTTYPNLIKILFTLNGQNLNDKFEVYKGTIVNSTLDELTISGILILGEFDEIKEITKKFSLLS